MKKLLFSILLACFLALPAKAALPLHGFFSTAWGTSKQQVLTDTHGVEHEGKVISSILRDSGTRIIFFYEFDKDGKLQRVTTFAHPPGVPNDQAMVDFCSSAGASFEEKYGPYQLIEVSVINGPLIIWANEDTEVHMMCDFAHKTFVTLFQRAELPRILVLPQKKAQTF